MHPRNSACEHIYPKNKRLRILSPPSKVSSKIIFKTEHIFIHPSDTVELKALQEALIKNERTIRKFNYEAQALDIYSM